MDKEKPSQSDNETSKSKNTGNTFPHDLNPEELRKEFQDLVKEKFGGKVQVLAMDEAVPFPEDESSEEFESASINAIEDFQYKPVGLKKYLDRFVIGQDEAKKALAVAICDHYNHLKAQLNDGEVDHHYNKQNVLILGPTGVGKTYLVRLISQLIGVPFVKADATRFSEVGYMGANVDDIIRDLVQNAKGNKELAEQGIVYVDEVDKLASRRDHTGRDVSGRGVQFGFLRLLENSDVDLNASHDMASQFKTFMNFQKKGRAEKEIINTKNILFIFSGAFHGLEELINKRLNKKSIGLHVDKKDEKTTEVLRKVEARDLVDFGFEHEFIGRLPIRVSCDELDEHDLYNILTQSEESIVQQYVQSFKYYGIELYFDEQALKTLAKKAVKQRTGARGLVAVFEETLRPFKFALPSTSLKRLDVTEELIKNPQGFLHHLTD